MKTNIVVSKKNRTLGIRLADAEIEQITAFAVKTGIPLAEMVRRLLNAARDCFEANEGWPAEIAVVKKPKGPAVEIPLNDESRNLPATNRDASQKTPTNRTPRPHQKGGRK